VVRSSFQIPANGSAAAIGNALHSNTAYNKVFDGSTSQDAGPRGRLIAVLYSQLRRPGEKTVHDGMPADGEPKPRQLPKILDDNGLTNPEGKAVCRTTFDVNHAVIFHVNPRTTLQEVFVPAQRIQLQKITPMPGEPLLSGQPERIILRCQQAAVVRQQLAAAWVEFSGVYSNRRLTSDQRKTNGANTTYARPFTTLYGTGSTRIFSDHEPTRLECNQNPVFTS